ncbi:MAG TPA: ABC transporter ATP-binding protein [Ignavibacteria bacterium]|nr:ABC transporter ATP-binding protein [Ignavibacteria bacterium]
MEKVVQAVNLTKVYQKNNNMAVYALNDVSVEIAKGEFIAIMGASGSGKSTLMNILGCLDRPSEGKVLLDGEEVNKHDDETLAKIRNKKIGFVFQTFNLLSRTNALENVELPLIYSDKDNLTDLAKNALIKVGLGDRLDHQPNELSGGQQQRVAIARALVNDPEIIFADEPTGNLDTKSGYEIMDLFQKLNETGVTVVVVTHEPDIAEYASRIIKITDGKIVSDEKNINVRLAKEELNNIEKSATVKD